MLMRSLRFLFCGLSFSVLAYPAMAEFVPETAHVEVLGDHRDQNWFWIWGSNAPNMVDGRAYLFDDNGRNLGLLSTGMWTNGLVLSHKRDEIYATEIYFSRGVRGTRSDVVTVYDAKTLSPKREIEIPAKRMSALISTGLSVLSDDERFLLVLNFTPAQSISIVDLEKHRFVSEVAIPGCASIYPAGPRDFYAICGNGGFFHLRLDDQGQVVSQERTAPVFDPLQDLLLTTGSRIGDTWYFVSQKNNAYGIKMDAQGVEASQRWSLVSDDERADGWSIAGNHGTALHQNSGRLYVLMHQDKPENYQKPGTEVWVYDIRTQKRLARIELNELSTAIGVSQGEQPRLYSLDWVVPMPSLFTLWIYLTEGEAGLTPLLRQGINIYDANSGEHQRSIGDIPLGFLNVVAPW
ncbi:amine dehydrogenase [Pseudomonas aeruginosa]|uniref:amine dehydrogenase large subunit n=1 Tax=Pseudomonas aeruginosa TaxID=287 RepID=UPI000BB7661D|nr:amine dehydrogenase large subunit [Pseudomonas aeruginosa]PBZ54980.1 amine dehydrogenase [Pseudomonas aeruginosa]PBZ60721.1 amine dehydrogenase [Pseudomonas aeruginosa]PBZ67640.1 amine dehydrogenase [Pseudomonas aeruginosa]